MEGTTMNLKEAFRYQNKLQSFLDNAQSILDRDSNVTREHLSAP